jgi:hypothetical protein
LITSGSSSSSGRRRPKRRRSGAPKGLSKILGEDVDALAGGYGSAGATAKPLVACAASSRSLTCVRCGISLSKLASASQKKLSHRKPLQLVLELVLAQHLIDKLEAFGRSQTLLALFAIQGVERSLSLRKLKHSNPQAYLPHALVHAIQLLAQRKKPACGISFSKLGTASHGANTLHRLGQAMRLVTPRKSRDCGVSHRRHEATSKSELRAAPLWAISSNERGARRTPFANICGPSNPRDNRALVRVTRCGRSPQDNGAG